MKKWETPEVMELKITDTMHDWLGNSRDGGYIGDGIISGHLKWECNNGEDNKTENGLS